MPVRVTQNMLNNNMMRNMNNSLGKMDKLQEMASSGRKISRPSDDPVVATRGMYYRSSLMENEQFQRNVNQAKAWMETTDQAFDDATNIMNRVKELTIQSGGTLPLDGLKAIAAEIDELRGHLGTVANSSVGGRYVFAGTDTDSQPFDTSTGTFTNTNSADINLELSPGIYIPINVKGTAVFTNPSSSDNIFQLLTDISNTLKSGQSAVGYIDKIDSQSSNLITLRTNLGARVNRIELMDDRLQTDNVNINKLMSDNEDADMAQVITDLKMQENVYRSALGVGARIIQPSLLDFLR